MLSSVTLNSRVTMIVMNSGHEISTISHKLTSHVMSLSWSLYSFLYLSFVFQQVMSPHHSDQMSQMSQYSRIALWWCSLYVYVFVGFVLVIFLSRSCLPIVVIKCIKGHKSLGLLFEGVPLMHLSSLLYLFLWKVTRSQVTSHKSQGHKSLGSLCQFVFKKVSQSVSEWVSDKVNYWAVGWTAK